MRIRGGGVGRDGEVEGLRRWHCVVEALSQEKCGKSGGNCPQNMSSLQFAMSSREVCLSCRWIFCGVEFGSAEPRLMRVVLDFYVVVL